MWSKNETLKATGQRFFNISDRLVSALGTDFGEVKDGVLSIHFKKEKELKDALATATISVLKVETLEELANIQLTESTARQGEDSWKFDRLRGIATGSNTPFNVDGTPIPTFNKYCSVKSIEAFYSKVASDTQRSDIDWSDDPMGFRQRSTNAMDRGNDLESEALDIWYGNNPEWMREEKGLIYDELLGAGVSLDNLATHLDTLQEKILEVKNPNLSTFTGYLLNPYRAKAKYNTQIQLQMIVSGVHLAELVINYPRQKQITIGYTLDIGFAINALQTLKKMNEQVSNGLNALILNQD